MFKLLEKQLNLTLNGGNNMKYSEAKQGRVFIIRLEDGDILHESIEAFAREHSIKAANWLWARSRGAAGRLFPWNISFTMFMK